MAGRQAGEGVQRAIQPDDIGPPLGRYAHAIEVAPGARHLAISGQVGVAPDGKVADGIEAQLEMTWANIVSILGAAGMTTADIIKVTTYVTKPEHFAVHPRIRAKVLGEHRATATAVCVSALASAEYLCEIDVLAAAPALPK